MQQGEIGLTLTPLSPPEAFVGLMFKKRTPAGEYGTGILTFVLKGVKHLGQTVDGVHRLNQSHSWPKQSKYLKYHFQIPIPIPLKFNQKKGQYRYNTGKYCTLVSSYDSYRTFNTVVTQDIIRYLYGGLSLQTKVSQLKPSWLSVRL